MYQDPATETFGTFLGSSFFISFYKDSKETHIPPPGTFLEIYSNITENTFLYYFDTDLNEWVRNCKDPIVSQNILRVELCHATQYALFQLTFNVPSNSAPKSTDLTVVAVIVVVLVIVIGGLAAALVVYRRKLKVRLRKWEM